MTAFLYQRSIISIHARGPTRATGTNVTSSNRGGLTSPGPRHMLAAAYRQWVGFSVFHISGRFVDGQWSTRTHSEPQALPAGGAHRRHRGSGGRLRALCTAITDRGASGGSDH